MLSPRSLNLLLKEVLMKEKIHPKVNTVVFKDISCDFSFLGTSTLDSKEKVKWTDGKEYPLIKVEISSASHPFYTGKQRVIDTEGRIDRFKRRYGKGAPTDVKSELKSEEKPATTK